MLEPVAGERFDLVVSNPPFVITPHAGAAGRAVADALGDYEYRDGGRAGDDLVRDLILGVGGVLAPGGTAQLLGNWEHRRGEPWTERVGAWLDKAGLDGWIIQREVLDPAEYAETWIRDGGTTPDREPDAWAAAYGAWLDDFESRDVEAVGFGLVTLRRPLSGACHAAAPRGAHGFGPAAARRAHRPQPRRPRLAHGAGRRGTRGVPPDHGRRHHRGALPDARRRRPEHSDPAAGGRAGPRRPRVEPARRAGGRVRRGADGRADRRCARRRCSTSPPDDLAAELLPAVRGLVRDGFLAE